MWNIFKWIGCCNKGAGEQVINVIGLYDVEYLGEEVLNIEYKPNQTYSIKYIGEEKPIIEYRREIVYEIEYLGEELIEIDYKCNKE